MLDRIFAVLNMSYTAGYVILLSCRQDLCFVKHLNVLHLHCGVPPCFGLFVPGPLKACLACLPSEAELPSNIIPFLINI